LPIKKINQNAFGKFKFTRRKMEDYYFIAFLFAIGFGYTFTSILDKVKSFHEQKCMTLILCEFVKASPFIAKELSVMASTPPHPPEPQPAAAPPPNPQRD
tara:strand:+ start:4373 stop:4672 length:300 start_codon:yes stop_codon:yes gene_type:complete